MRNNHTAPGMVSVPVANMQPGDVIVWTKTGELLHAHDCNEVNPYKLAAAGEMYQMLKEAVDNYGKLGGSWLDKARKALEKARGEK